MKFIKSCLVLINQLIWKRISSKKKRVKILERSKSIFEQDKQSANVVTQIESCRYYPVHYSKKV